MRRSMLPTDEVPVWRALDIWSRVSSKAGIKAASATCSRFQSINGHRKTWLGPVSRMLDRKAVGVEESSRFMVRPCSSQRMTWDTLSMVFLAYDMFWVPMVLFDFPETHFSYALSWTIRMFWTLDFAASMMTGYYLPNGNLEMRASEVFRRFARSWMLPDLLVLMVEWLTLLLEDAVLGAAKMSRSARLLRLVRMIRLLRMAKVPRLLEMVFERILSETVAISMQIMSRVTGIMSFAHLVACMFFALGSLDNTSGWVVREKYDDADRWHQYAVALHWSTANIASGNMEMALAAMQEHFFAVCVLILSFVVSAAFVSSVTSLMTRLCILSHGQASHLNIMRRFLVAHEVSSTLMSRLMCNAQQALDEKQRMVPEAEVELLRLCSQPLLTELHFELRMPTLSLHPLFDRYSIESGTAVRRLCHTGISETVFFRGDLLFSAGELPSTSLMFFVKNGILEYLTHSSARAEVMPGEWVAEPSLWVQDWIYHGSLRAMDEARLMTLHGEALQDAIRTCPTCNFDIGAYATAFAEELNNAGADQCSDLAFVVDAEKLVNACFGPKYNNMHEDLATRLIRMSVAPVKKLAVARPRSSNFSKVSDLEFSGIPGPSSGDDSTSSVP